MSRPLILMAWVNPKPPLDPFDLALARMAHDDAYGNVVEFPRVRQKPALRLITGSSS